MSWEEIPEPKGASEKDFSEAPIFKMYGPSPSMVKYDREWRGLWASIPTREGQRLSGQRKGPRLAKGAK